MQAAAIALVDQSQLHHSRAVVAQGPLSIGSWALSRSVTNPPYSGIRLWHSISASDANQALNEHLKAERSSGKAALEIEDRI